MGFLSAYSGTRTIHLDGHYWVELREHLSQGAREASERELARIAVVDGAAIPEPNIARSRQLTVLASIVSWNLDEDDGTPWALTLANVQRLPGAVFELLFQAADASNEPRRPEEMRQFPDAGLSRDPHGHAGAPVPADIPAGESAVDAAWAAQRGLGVPA